MKKTNKGFTIVELVVVIAVVAVLAAVLIPTFTSIIKKANDSAYLQERQNQRIEDLAEKVENSKYLTTDEFEIAFAKAMAEYQSSSSGDKITAEDVAEEVSKQLARVETGVTEASVKKLIENALEGQLTLTQVESLIKSAVSSAGPSLTAAQVQQIVNAAIYNLPQTGITKAQLDAAIASIDRQGLSEAQVKDLINKALANIQTYTENDIETIVERIVSNLATHVLSEEDKAKQAEGYVININGTYYKTISKDNLTSADNAAGGSGTTKPIEWDGEDFCFHGNNNAYLIGNVTIPEGTTGVANSLTLDLNGYSLILKAGMCPFSATITIKDSGNGIGSVFSAESTASFFMGNSHGLFWAMGSTINIEGGVFDLTNISDSFIDTNYGSCNINISGGYFKAASGKSIFASSTKSNPINISGGVFDASADGSTVFGFKESAKSVGTGTAKIIGNKYVPEG